MDRASAAYDEDFYAWTRTQAAELRRAGAAGTDAPVDWKSVAEEIDGTGRSQKSETDSRLVVLLVHLPKWLYCPELRERCERGWRPTIREQRRKLVRELRDSPSLRGFPPDPPFTLDQALDPAYPAELFPPEWR